MNVIIYVADTTFNIMSEWSTEAASPSLYVADPAHGAPRAPEGGPHAVPPVFGRRGWGRFSYLSMDVQKHCYSQLTHSNDVENTKNSLKMYSKELEVGERS